MVFLSKLETFYIVTGAFGDDVLRSQHLMVFVITKLLRSNEPIDSELESRRGQCCDISARRLWQVRNFNHWYIGSKSAARCRTLLSEEKPFELCKGDLSITLFFSMGGGVCEVAATTFSASGGCC
jgi:hypothetical protein